MTDIDKAKKWKTQDGRVLLISNMATSHIINCIRRLNRNGYISQRAWVVPPPSTSDLALMVYEHEVKPTLERTPSKYIDYFNDELKKRGKKKCGILFGL